MSQAVRLLISYFILLCCFFLALAFFPSVFPSAFPSVSPPFSARPPAPPAPPRLPRVWPKAAGSTSPPRPPPLFPCGPDHVAFRRGHILLCRVLFLGVPRCPGATQVHVMSNPYFCHGTQEGTQGDNHLGGPRVGWLLSPDPPIWLPRVPHSGFNGRMLSSLVPSWPPSCSMASFCRGYLLGWVTRFLLSPGFPHV